MNFASDNVYGVSPEVMDALIAANDGTQPSYAEDACTKRAEEMFCDLFGRDVSVFLLANGTAANVLALAAITPAYRAILCHEEAHVMVEECGGAEFFTGGAKLIPIWGDDGKITADGLRSCLSIAGARPPHHIIPASMSLTQSTESGTVYTLDELSDLTTIARDHDLKVHMDGARFGNAVASLGCTPAEMTWGAGIDVASFGMTKNGAMAADALVFFDKDLAASVPFTRMRSGHLWSKGRYLGAQFSAMLEGDLWLENARRANAMAARLAEGLQSVVGARIASPVEANELFCIFSADLHGKLQDAGAVYSDWPGDGPKGPGSIGEGEILIRLVTSFATTEESVDRFIATAKS